MTGGLWSLVKWGWSKACHLQRSWGKTPWLASLGFPRPRHSTKVNFMLRQKIDFLSVAILITKVVLLSNSILCPLSLSLCSESTRKREMGSRGNHHSSPFGYMIFFFRNKLVCISLDFAEYLLGVQAHIAQRMHHVQLSSSDGIPMKLHMIQWMIRRAKADQVRERHWRFCFSLSLYLCLSVKC